MPEAAATQRHPPSTARLKAMLNHINAAHDLGTEAGDWELFDDVRHRADRLGKADRERLFALKGQEGESS